MKQRYNLISLRFKKNLLTDFGFTLIELLFTLTLVGILLALAFPGYRYLIAQVRLLLLVERICTAVDYARSEAIKRQCRVVLCKSEDRKSCSGTWRDGWIIFFNKEENGSKEPIILRVYPSLDKSEFLEWRGSRSHNYLYLSPDGSTYGQNGSFIVCVQGVTKKIGQLLKISQTGRLRIDKQFVVNNGICNY